MAKPLTLENLRTSISKMVRDAGEEKIIAYPCVVIYTPEKEIKDGEASELSSEA